MKKKIKKSMLFVMTAATLLTSSVFAAPKVDGSMEILNKDGLKDTNVCYVLMPSDEVSPVSANIVSKAFSSSFMDSSLTLISPNDMASMKHVDINDVKQFYDGVLYVAFKNEDGKTTLTGLLTKGQDKVVPVASYIGTIENTDKGKLMSDKQITSALLTDMAHKIKKSRPYALTVKDVENVNEFQKQTVWGDLGKDLKNINSFEPPRQ